MDDATALDQQQLQHILGRVIDPEEFLSPNGIRSLSRAHAAADHASWLGYLASPDVRETGEGAGHILVEDFVPGIEVALEYNSDLFDEAPCGLLVTALDHLSDGPTWCYGWPR